MDAQGPSEAGISGVSGPARDPDPARSRRRRSWIVAAGAAAALTVAGLGVAAAQTGGSPPPANSDAPAPEGARRPGPGRGPHGKGFGMGIHGEFVTRAPAGGYQTIAHQRGEVTEVSNSSITVRSEDGFSRTCGVDDNTMVNAGNQGIGDVKQGDQVPVTAVVREGRASAVHVRDITQMDQHRDRWHPRPGV